MKEYLFTLTYDDYTAKLSLTGEWSLYDFAELLINALDFSFDHAFEFCDNLRDPYGSKERYTLFADIGEEADDPGVRRTKVSEVFTPRRKMAFLFDYGDDWCFLITCTAVRETEGRRRLRKILSTSGTPPEQYPDLDCD